MVYPLYQKAKDLLYAEYHKNMAIVKDDPFFSSYENEKLRHSLQVSGVGNGILKHESYFQNRSPKFIDMARTAILLHDIFRFTEVRILYESGKKVDHSLLGAELLKKLPDFSNILITLPIKHHGHMIECLYEDEEYQNIADKQLQQDVKYIAFAVRDADKIANWHYLTSCYDQVYHLWLKHYQDKSATQGIINPKTWEYFMRAEVVPKGISQTNADDLMATLCWLFDINYRYSMKYCLSLDLFTKYMRLFSRIQVPSEQITAIYKVVADFCLKHFNEKI